MKVKFTLCLLFLIITGLLHAQPPKLWGPVSSDNTGKGALISIDGDGNNMAVEHRLSGSDGTFPGGSLVLSSNRIFYGTAFQGGTKNGGVLFSYDPQSGTYTILYNLAAINSWVNSDLVLAGDSVLYGINYQGPTAINGNIFSFNISSKTYTAVYSFTDTTLGKLPRNIMMGQDHKLYGSTDQGGLYDNGVIFSYDISTGTYANLHNFNDTLGKGCTGAFCQVANGKIYGICSGGGTHATGTLFSFNPEGNVFTHLHDFDVINGNPLWNNGLAEAANGKLYGITFDGGTNTKGVIFCWDTLNNRFTKLYDLNYSDGSNAIGKMIRASDGNLYGMILSGGLGSAGTIFKFTPDDSTFTKIADLSPTKGQNPYGNLTELPANTGVHNLYSTNTINVYPNPANNLLQVSGMEERGKFVVSDLMGSSVSTTHKAQGNHPTAIDVAGLSPGIYFVTFYSANGNVIQKFVKD